MKHRVNNAALKVVIRTEHMYATLRRHSHLGKFVGKRDKNHRKATNALVKDVERLETAVKQLVNATYDEIQWP